MPLVGISKAAGDDIDVISIENSNRSNGNDLMPNKSVSDNGTLANRIKAINEILENNTCITLDQLFLNLVNSGNKKHAKLVSDLIDLNLIQRNFSENLGSDCFDKISVSANVHQNTEQGITLDSNIEMEILSIIESKVKVNQAKILEQNQELR